MTEPWVWDDETEACVSRLFRDSLWRSKSRRASVQWLVAKAMDEIGNKSDLGMVSSAVAAHMSGRPEEFRKR